MIMFQPIAALLFLAVIHGWAYNPAELDAILALRICEIYGGTCGEVCPDRYLTHRWLPLCPLTPIRWECCIGPEPEAGETENSTTTTAISTTTTTSGSTTPEPATISTTAAPEYEKCGILQSHENRRKRIVGGQVSAPGRWPWLIALRSLFGAIVCSGAVVSQRWVITAAHCFKHIAVPGAWRVRLGEHDLLDWHENETELKIQDIILHPGYATRTVLTWDNRTLLTYVHDLALIRLAQDSRKQPICLPKAEGYDDITQRRFRRNFGNLANQKSSQIDLGNKVDDGLPDMKHLSKKHVDVLHANRQQTEISDTSFEEPDLPTESGDFLSSTQDGTCWVAGWGLTKDPTILDQLLREVSGESISHAMCSDMWRAHLGNDTICFGDGHSGPCSGDSGGPLACYKAGRYFLEGVVSWGSENCNMSGYPSVFTRIDAYLDWIHAHMSRYS